MEEDEKTASTSSQEVIRTTNTMEAIWESSKVAMMRTSSKCGMTAKSKECWSIEAGADMTQICPTQNFFVSANALKAVGSSFGPGKRLRHRDSDWRRYGWELVCRILRKQRLNADEKAHGIGIRKLLNFIVPPGTNILTAVAYYARELFSLPPAEDEELRKQFLYYCDRRLKVLRARGSPTKKRPLPLFAKSHGKVVQKHLPLLVSISRAHTGLDGTSKKESVASSSSLTDKNEFDLSQAHDFVQRVITNNRSVSSEDLESAMKDEELLRQVKIITNLHKSMETCTIQTTGEKEKKNEKDKKKKKKKSLDDKFVKVKPPGVKMDFYMPAACLKETRGPCQEPFHNKDKCQVCLACSGHSVDDSQSLLHIARQHYIPKLCEVPLRAPEEAGTEQPSGEFRKSLFGEPMTTKAPTVKDPVKSRKLEETIQSLHLLLNPKLSLN